MKLVDSSWFPTRNKADSFARQKRKDGYHTETKRPGFYRKSGWVVNVYEKEGVENGNCNSGVSR